MNFHAKWIYISSKANCKKEAVFFRREFTLDQTGPGRILHISADSRYKLYVNGKYVVCGPLKGDEFRKYYDTVDISDYVKKGKNCIGVHLLHFPQDSMGAVSFQTGPVSVNSGSRGALLIEGEGDLAQVNTDSGWFCKKDSSYHFVHAVQSKYSGDQEQVDFTVYPSSWNLPGFDFADFVPAVELADAVNCRLGGVLYDWQLVKRDIPFLYEKPIRPSGIAGCSKNVDFSGLLAQKPVVIPPHTTCYVDVDMGELVTSYLNIGFETTGTGASCTLLYSECCYSHYDEFGSPVKGIRDNYCGGFLAGEKDIVKPRKGMTIYEPFFFRTFRYLRIRMKTADAPVCMNSLHFRMTGYPFQNMSCFQAADPSLNAMWEISFRTLERCMHETYEDCPYYEQMQYVMDTLIQTLLTYRVTNDDRLARKALLDFHSTQRPDGMIACNAPATFWQIIPIFSIYFIDMVYGHYEYFGDPKILETYLPTLYRILDYFHGKIDPETGLVGTLPYWQFVDWVDDWRENHGCPVKDGDDQPIYINSMIYAYGLRRAAALFHDSGLHDIEKRLQQRLDLLTEAVNTHAYDPENKYYRTLSGDGRFSQHAQLWAVLSGCTKGKAAANLMERCLGDESLQKCSYSMMYFLFRAGETAGVYLKTIPLWDTWKDLIALNVTTWPEDPVTQRSECHGWSAVPMYELSSGVMGINPLRPGYDGVLIRPKALLLGSMSCTVATCKGAVTVHRTVEKQEGDIYSLLLDITLPEEMELLLELPDGQKFNTRTKGLKQKYSVKERN